jgi:hypothetical protein
MPKREQLISQLQGDDEFGVLLMGQMGGVPNELQLIVQTVTYDEAAGGLRDRARYIIRALGVREHKLVLGLFKTLRFTTDHPLLYPHNTPSTGVFFRGGLPEGINLYELIVDITQAHEHTFAGWRSFAEDVNHTVPLVDLLKSGGGVLGEMPKPAAERVAKVLERYGIEHKLIEDPAFRSSDERGRSSLAEALLIDEGYVVSLAFSVEQMGQV